MIVIRERWKSLEALSVLVGEVELETSLERLKVDEGTLKGAFSKTSKELVSKKELEVQRILCSCSIAR
jgi:hypothetical protein